MWRLYYICWHHFGMMRFLCMVLSKMCIVYFFLQVCSGEEYRFKSRKGYHDFCFIVIALEEGDTCRFVSVRGDGEINAEAEITFAAL